MLKAIMWVFILLSICYFIGFEKVFTTSLNFLNSNKPMIETATKTVDKVGKKTIEKGKEVIKKSIEEVENEKED